jgi:rSAM/selenodomain-associated transferase 1
MAAEPTEPIEIAVLAKAPIVGFAKTRLVPVLGLEGSALLQTRLIERAVATASAAAVGPVTIWATPNEGHAVFDAMRARFGVALARQPEGDLGARMLAATMAATSPTLVIGTDCPVLTAGHLRIAAGVLRRGADVVAFPAEDGGYTLIGTRRPLPLLFCDMRWGTAEVMTETRSRLTLHGLAWQEPYTLWDVDVPDDLVRLQMIGLHELVPLQTD